MRTTISLEPDVAAAVDRVRHERGVGLSAAVNQLVRSGLAERAATRAAPYQPRSAPVGIKIDVTNVADVLDALDETG